MWRAISEIVAAHVVMLRDEDVFDEPVAQAVLSALEATQAGAVPATDGPTTLVAAFDQRLDALTSPEAAGAGGVARLRAETASTAMRLVIRNELLTTMGAINQARLGWITFGGQHTLTIMPGYGEGRPLQPTTLAHWLTGLTGPLARAVGVGRQAYGEINRSAIGAGNLAGSNLRVNREAVAQMLACDGAVESTFDALSGVDYLAAATMPCAIAAGAIQRFAEELRTWLRAEPGSLRVSAGWVGESDPGLPQSRPARLLDRLVMDAVAISTDAASLQVMGGKVPYGPAGEMAEEMFARSVTILRATAVLAEQLARLATGELEVNRAWLASRAGREMTTVGDLADFLLLEEGIDPASSRAIASMVIRKAIDEGQEATAITTQAIDAAALLVIGRELGIEMEKLGAWLAPRRFLERRTGLGSAGTGPTRDLLEHELIRTRSDERWREERLAAISEAHEALAREVDAMLSEHTA